MNHLVGNGSRLYRRDEHLVRTPIYKTITLSPDQRAWYAVAGSYSNGWPTAGFISGSSSWTGCVPVGKRMRRAFLSPGANQMWRAVTTAHDPEFVFYQGVYSTATNTEQCEAYMQLCAYHFTIPEQYAGWGVDSVSLSMMHGGTIFAYGNARAQSSRNLFIVDVNGSDFSLTDISSWKQPWEQNFGLYQTLDDPAVMLRAATDIVALNTTTRSGTASGSRELWGSGNDGYIPTASSPYVQTVGLSQNISSALSTQRGGWIVGMPNVSVSTAGDDTDTANDYPCFDVSNSTSMAARWLCCSHWGHSLTVRIYI